MKTPREMLLDAVRIRRIEERIVEIYPTDLIQSPLHLSIGQEAVAVGVCAGLNDKDQLFATYRSHAFYVAKGGDIKKFFAELMGRVTGCCEGKGGSMHLADSAVNFMGTSAIVASTIPHAVGAAYANKLKNLDSIVVSVFGDGAADAGVYHESINFAALHRLPLVFVVEDNGLAVHSAKSERQSFDLREHAKAYGLLTYNLDQTQSPYSVAELMNSVYFDVKTKNQTAWVRLKTFRYLEHVGINEDFDKGYRSKREYQSWSSEDPIAKVQLTPNEEDAIRSEIENAVDFAINSPFPSNSDLYKDVY